MVDVRYLIVFSVLLITAVVIKFKPQWATSLTLGLAAAAFAYAVLFAA